MYIHNTHWIHSHAQNATRKAEITYLVLEKCYHTCGIARSFPIPTEFPSGTMCDMYSAHLCSKGTQQAQAGLFDHFHIFGVHKSNIAKSRLTKLCTWHKQALYD